MRGKEIFSITPRKDLTFEFVQMERSRELFNNQLKLWEMISQWSDLTRKWLHGDFTKIDVELMNKQTTQCFKVAFGLEKSFGPKNPKVIKAAKEQVKFFSFAFKCC